MDNNIPIADEMEYRFIDTKINSISWKSIPGIFKNSVKNVLVSTLKWIFPCMLAVVFAYSGWVSFIAGEKTHIDAFFILSGVLLVLLYLCISGLIHLLVASADSEEIGYSYFFRGFIKKPFKQILLLLLPSLYLLTVGVLLLNVGAFDLWEEIVRRGSSDDIGWYSLIFFVELVFLLPGILWFYFSIYLLVSGESLNEEFEFNHLISKPIVAIKKNFFKLLLVFFIYFLVTATLIFIFVPLAIIAPVVFLALVVNLGREIFLLVDKTVII